MLRLQIYLPNALKRNVFDALPRPPPFNWFFFGKKFYDAELGKPYLEVDKPCQFYCAATGVSYEVKGPTRFLIASEGEPGEPAGRAAVRAGYAGAARRRPAGDMDPPIPSAVTFWVVPSAVTALTNWEKSNLLRYASREPEHSWKSIQDLVGRVGIENASRLVYADEY